MKNGVGANNNMEKESSTDLSVTDGTNCGGEDDPIWTYPLLVLMSVFKKPEPLLRNVRIQQVGLLTKWAVKENQA